MSKVLLLLLAVLAALIGGCSELGPM